MKYKGIEIGEPTLNQIEEYVKRKGFSFDAKDVYIHYRGMGFKTQKGSPIISLEAMCNSYNGAFISNKRDSECSEIQEMESNQKQIFDYSPYKEQLNDIRWKFFRDFVFVVRGKKCEVCGSTKHLQIHHLHYNKNCFAWEYNVKEVIVLCDQCHRKVHNL